MPESMPTLGQVLAMPSGNNKGSERVQRDAQRFKDRVSEEIKKVHWTAKMPELVEKLSQVLDIPLPHLMIAAWKKGDEIRKALEDSRSSPDEEFDLDLDEHTISTDFEPEIEVQVAGVPAAVLKFAVKFTLELKEMELRIRAGMIREIRTGTCQATGALLFDDLVLAERKGEPIQLPGVISLD